MNRPLPGGVFARIVMALVLVVGYGTEARAELRALLVGVSSYPTLPERLRLEGPRNDVQHMRRALVDRGFSPTNIRVLADGVPNAEPPTRANILAALKTLGDTARAEDVVLVYFAGHGSRQPADRPDPAGRTTGGGLDATFLPIDVAAWDGGKQAVRNAITGFELRTAIDMVSDRGAFVWGVFDTCHSAVLVRGADAPEVRYRYVTPEALGIPKAAIDRALATAQRRTSSQGALDVDPSQTAGHRGATAFFYATQADELTSEWPLPAAHPKGPPRGIFSYVVTSALERGRTMTYRQMAQYVLTQYGTFVEARATPLFSGNGLDEAVFRQSAVPVRQWPLELGSLGVAAGRLAEVGIGTVFALLPGPLAKDSERVGHLHVVAADADHATLAPIAFGGQPAPIAAELKVGQYLRIVGGPPQYTLRVAFDANGCSATCALRSVGAGLNRQGVPGVDVKWVGTTESPDITLVQRGALLAFLPPDQQGGRGGAAPSPVIGLVVEREGRPLPVDELVARTARRLHDIARARNLLALAARTASETGPGEVTVALRHETANGAAGEIVPADQVPTLHARDRLALVLANAGPAAQDVTVVYVDADYGIQTLFPSGLGESNRIDPGARQTVDHIGIHAPPSGLERLIVISAKARSQDERTDFSFLAQPALTRTRGPSIEGSDALADAAFADYRTRGNAGHPALLGDRISMVVLTVRVAP